MRGADKVGEERHDAQHVVVVHGVVQHVVHVIRSLDKGDVSEVGN